MNKQRFTSWAILSALVIFNSSSALAKDRTLTTEEGALVSPIPVTTTANLEGYKIREYRGIVIGITVRQPTMGQSFKANLKGVVGGRISPFISMCATARQQAFDDLIARAQAAGGNAVIGLRYDSSSFGDSDDMGTEVVCYGTAVVVERESKQANNPNRQMILSASDD